MWFRLPMYVLITPCLQIVSLVCLGIINGTAASAVFMDSVRYEKDVAVSVSRWKISLAGFVMCGVVMFYISVCGVAVPPLQLVRCHF